MDTVTSDAPTCALPPDLEAWRKPSRWFLRTLVSLPSWVSHAFAWVTDAQLAEWRQCSERTIRRMSKEALQRGEIERRWVKKGALLPDGSKAKRGLYILVEGPARRARLDGANDIAPTVMAPEAPMGLSMADRAAAEADRDAAEARAAVRELAESLRGQSVRFQRTNDPPQPDTLSRDRSIDLLQSNELSAEPDPVPETSAVADVVVADVETPAESESVASAPIVSDTPVPEPSDEQRSTSLHSLGSTETTANNWQIAHDIATHYGIAIGQKWRWVHRDIITCIMSFVAGMNGSPASKIERASAVIDEVIASARSRGDRLPSIRYIFHPQLFWKRLGKLSGGSEGASTSRGPTAPLNASPEATSRPYKPLASTMGAWEPPTAALPTAPPRVTVVDSDDAELVAMAVADNEARQRHGLAPRYLVRTTARSA